MKSLKTYISILKTVKNRPTKYFTFLIIALVSLFVQAYMHNYNIVFIVMFFLVGIAMASSIFGIQNLYHIKIEFLSHKRFFVSEGSSFVVSILNVSDKDSYDIDVLYRAEKIYIKNIKAHHKQSITFSDTFKKRGEASLSEFKIFSFFPLPHELKYKEINIDKKIVVYPKPYGVSIFRFYSKNSSLNGEIDEFDGIKEFNEGDSTSYIHWASLAKTNSLMLKNFIYEQESKKFHFKLEDIKGNIEEKLSQLTLWVLECEKYHLNFSVEMNAKVYDSKKMSTDEILKKIAKY